MIHPAEASAIAGLLEAAQKCCEVGVTFDPIELLSVEPDREFGVIVVTKIDQYFRHAEWRPKA